MAINLEDLRLPETDEEGGTNAHKIRESIESQARLRHELATQQFYETEKIRASQQQNHKEMLIDIQVEALRRHAAEKQAKTQPPSGRIDGAVTADRRSQNNRRQGKDRRNPSRLKILEQWYAAFCLLHKNNRELIIEKINTLTNDEIKNKLANLTPQDKKYLWTNGAIGGLRTMAQVVWGFKKTQGGKSKQL